MVQMAITSDEDNDKDCMMDSNKISNNERNMGEQPIHSLLEECSLSAHDLVAASTEQITHKMVSRARKGRRLTPHVQIKIMNAFNAASGKTCTVSELFTY